MQPYSRGKWLPWASQSYSMMYMTRHIDETLNPHVSIFFSNFVWRSLNRDQTFSNTTKSPPFLLIFFFQKYFSSPNVWVSLASSPALPSSCGKHGCPERLRSTKWCSSRHHILLKRSNRIFFREFSLGGMAALGVSEITLKPLKFSWILSEDRQTVVKLLVALIGLLSLPLILLFYTTQRSAFRSYSSFRNIDRLLPLLIFFFRISSGGFSDFACRIFSHRSVRLLRTPMDSHFWLSIQPPKVSTSSEPSPITAPLAAHC